MQGTSSDHMSDDEQQRERRLALLIGQLPPKLRRMVQWMRQPSARWVRIPAACLLMLGSLLFFLPLLGIWMLPLGLLLLGEDLPPLRRFNHRVLSWVERRWERRRGRDSATRDRP